jgi:hypothetical protein
MVIGIVPEFAVLINVPIVTGAPKFPLASDN